jgi:spoIIIJ-associated protein
MDDREFVAEVQNLDEARRLGALKWSVDPEEVEVTVLGEDKKLFGILGKKMQVRIALPADAGQLDARGFVGQLVEMMALDIKADFRDDGIVNLSGEDAGIIIGRYGETLKALEYVTNLTLRDDASRRRLRFDSDGYRTRREESLEKLASAAAREAVRKGRAVKLEPMSSWERRVVHLALKEREDVRTSSTGSEPLRRVVVTPAASQGRKSSSRSFSR